MMKWSSWCGSIATTVFVCFGPFVACAADPGPTVSANGGSMNRAGSGGTELAGGGAAAASGAAGIAANGGQSGSSNGGAAAQAGAGGSAGATAHCAVFADPTQPIENLTDTGCVDHSDPTKPASYMIPYQVNSPLWSDAADKQRFMRIPAGSKIHVIDCVKEKATTCAVDPFTGVDGHFDFPVGTVMMKTFGFEGTIVETRLLMKFDASTWVGYSYQWNQAQTEATVLPNARRSATFLVGPSRRSQEWKYPSRADCSTCHTDYAGVTLGPELRQLNRMEATENQLDRLEKLGILDSPLKKPLQAPLLAPTGSQGTVQDRARSYLHANCSYCHRPDGDQVLPDLRYTEPFDFKKMGICDAKPGRGDVGAAGGSAAARFFAPGHPENSVISLRMKSLDTNVRMPQLATVVADGSGVAAIDAWIQSVTKCPQ